MNRVRHLALAALTAFLLATLFGCYEDSRPIAFLGSAKVNGPAPLDVSFNLSFSEHSQGLPMTFELDFGDGSQAETGSEFGIAIHHTYELGGTYVATLTLTDSEGSRDADELTITVSQDGPPIGTSVGMTAPNFTSGTTDGEGTFTLSDLRGRVVLLDFWGAWCPPCRKSMPHLDELAEVYGPDGLVAVIVSTDTSEQESINYLNSNGYSRFVSLWEPGGRYTPIALQYGVLGDQGVGVPHTILIDRQGVIRFRGHPVLDLTEAMIEALL